MLHVSDAELHSPKALILEVDEVQC